MLVVLECLGLLIVGLVVSKICVGLCGKISHNKNIINKESKNIVYRAEALADNLCLLDDNHMSYFEYNTAFYEELFFLCCIEAVKLSNNKIDSNLYDKIITKTFDFSNHIDGIKKYNTIKKIIDNTFQQRSMFYMSLITSYNHNLKNDFFSAAFDYQVTIFSIKYSNPEIKETLKTILQDCLPIIKEFYNSNI